MAWDDQDRAALDHAWRYFELHAKQRMVVFNFFVAAAGAAFAGLGLCLQKGPGSSLVGVVAGMLMVLVALVFRKLDDRSSHLVKLAEDAMADLEPGLPAGGRVILAERVDRTGSGRGDWTFGRAFRTTFGCVGAIGFVGAGLSAAVGLGWLSLVPAEVGPVPAASSPSSASAPR